MKRNSASIEEKARDALYSFLLTRNRAPLRALLHLYSADSVAPTPADLSRVTVETEVPTNLGSRVDLVVASKTTLLFVEVKVDCIEQVGQYEKYRHFFERAGYTVIAAGLINRVRNSRTKNNTAFLEALGVRRVFWSELLAAFEKDFANTGDFLAFRHRLSTISPAIGSPTTQTQAVPPPVRDIGLLTTRNDIVCQFFTELLGKLNPLEGSVWQYGNSPYCLAFGKRSWQQKFHEDWFHRAFICCDKSDPAAASFKLSVMLWNRTWTKNTDWFLRHRTRFVEQLTNLQFDVGRNSGPSWHRRSQWVPPYPVTGLKYVNAFWHSSIPIDTTDSPPAAWNALLDVAERHCRALVEIIDSIEIAPNV